MKDIILHITDRSGNCQEINVPSDCGMNLMELCRAAELAEMGTCGGIALCGTCQIYIDSNHEMMKPSDDELAMLDNLFFVKNNSRLACQIKINESIDGLNFIIAPEQ
jgi:ferredoxin